MGGNGKAAGRACPAYGVTQKWVADERGQGGGSPPPAVGGWLPENGCNGQPVGTLQASQTRPAPLMGSLLGLRPRMSSRYRHRGSGEHPTQKWRKGRGGVKNGQ